MDRSPTGPHLTATAHLMERRHIKIEIPLPSTRVLRPMRFTLRSLGLLVLLVALTLSVHRYATKTERSKHSGGYYHLVISTPDEFSTTFVRRNDYPDIPSLLQSNHTRKCVWPPKVWIMRPDFNATDLQVRVDLNVRGTHDRPVLDTPVTIKMCDTVYISAGRLGVQPGSLAGTNGGDEPSDAPESPSRAF
ncbi:hypothetical protein FF011L_39090 [Roseimaritima multifibrata]|uniref:Uncharacterized protein n=1 Tax=Roseimaritima multifibrata TaxID=1930274 RepID=A0A517MJQ3_9BACT|nr:hypothetical protein FF011L_39090 [Roseimaritima multifibrata]